MILCRTMEEYRFGNATVRIHGEYEINKLKSATEKFLKKAEAQRKRVQKSNTGKDRHGSNANLSSQNG